MSLKDYERILAKLEATETRLEASEQKIYRIKSLCDNCRTLYAAQCIANDIDPDSSTESGCEMCDQNTALREGLEKIFGNGKNGEDRNGKNKWEKHVPNVE